ncbi:hypothetical protein LDC_0867 [sediment metagenome]|uniref:Uncharacterized protein n=1 Tax=sediment metagenome TaxID=749907 RepID=D9PH67_9ZZZZ
MIWKVLLILYILINFALTIFLVGDKEFRLGLQTYKIIFSAIFVFLLGFPCLLIVVCQEGVIIPMTFAYRYKKRKRKIALNKSLSKELPQDINLVNF